MDKCHTTATKVHDVGLRNTINREGEERIKKILAPIVEESKRIEADVINFSIGAQLDYLYDELGPDEVVSIVNDVLKEKEK